VANFDEIQAKLQDAKVAVTGGTGFIGSHLVERLVEIGACVRVLTRTGNTENLEGVLRKIELRRYDLANRDEVKDALEGVEYVFHLAAAIPKEGIQYEHPIDSINANVVATVNICDAIIASGNCRKLVAASTTEVYGIPQKMPITEEHPTNPLTFYGVSKLAAEKFIQIYARRYNIDIAILRYSGVFGPREGSYKRAIPNFIRSILNGEAPKISGSGNQIRNYIYVGDIVEYTIRATAKTPSTVYNAGAINISIADLVNKLISLTNCGLKPKFVAPDIGQYDFVLDTSRIERELGYYGKTPIEVGLCKEIQWYLNKEG
jgi:UDP-glucose 4-epimerase